MNIIFGILVIVILAMVFAMIKDHKKERSFAIIKAEAIRIQNQYRKNIARGIYMF